MSRISRISKLFLVAGASIFLTGAPYAASNPPSPSSPQQAAPDNTKTNKGDEQKGAVTADQQKMNPADRTITQKIRAEIMKDKSLSTYAQNIKIITQDGKVTLKGPSRTQEEKSSVEAKAAAIAGDGNVTSQIQITAKKS